MAEDLRVFGRSFLQVKGLKILDAGGNVVTYTSGDFIGAVTQDQEGYVVLSPAPGDGTKSWANIATFDKSPSVRNLFNALLEDDVDFGEFTLASTPTNAQVELFTISAPAQGFIIIDKAFYQGIDATTLPNNGNTDAISFLWADKSFLNPGKEAALASEYPCYGIITMGLTQTATAGGAGTSSSIVPFDNATLAGRGYFQWDGGTLKWRSQYGGVQYTTFYAGREYMWIAWGSAV